MSSAHPRFTSLHRARRAACVVLGVFLLTLQSFAPVFAAQGQGDWIEICAEAGAVWVQVDLDEGDGDAGPCPDCARCALCAVTSAAPMPKLTNLTRFEFVQFGTFPRFDAYNSDNPAQFWPDTRGPPTAPEMTPERALRASMATTQNTGGAPWL